jgi:glycerol-1-phosphate dehydrogenase [NAD(P)+]
VESPQVHIFDRSDDEDRAAIELAGIVSDLGATAPLIVSSVHGHRLARPLEALEISTPEDEADQEDAAEIGSRARSMGADTIVAIGGGRCLDIGKLAAARAGLGLVAVPTQLSHDGISSPVAVVPNGAGIPESVGAHPPRTVFISVPTLVGAPEASVAAGIGDLLANPFALRDWALAAERGLEEIDQRAWDMSAESYALIEPHLDQDPHSASTDPRFLRELADALILSGNAMICSGTSRPASGAEHEISHAIDRLYAGRAMHGAQVAFGCIISVALYGEDTDAFRARLERLKLPQHPSALGLSAADMVRVLLRAPDTRPGRFTILEDANLDEGSATELVRRIWPDLEEA